MVAMLVTIPTTLECLRLEKRGPSGQQCARLACAVNNGLLACQLPLFGLKAPLLGQRLLFQPFLLLNGRTNRVHVVRQALPLEVFLLLQLLLQLLDAVLVVGDQLLVDGPLGIKLRLPRLDACVHHLQDGLAD